MLGEKSHGYERERQENIITQTGSEDVDTSVCNTRDSRHFSTKQMLYTCKSRFTGPVTADSRQ